MKQFFHHNLTHLQNDFAAVSSFTLPAIKNWEPIMDVEYDDLFNYYSNYILNGYCSKVGFYMIIKLLDHASPIIILR